MQNLKANEHVYVAPRVPQGLAAAVEGLTREVIRHQPDNIYVFAAQHFEKLLRLRRRYRCDDDSNGNDHNARAASYSATSSSDRDKKLSCSSRIPQSTATTTTTTTTTMTMNFESNREFRECTMSKETRCTSYNNDNYRSGQKDQSSWSLNETAKVLEKHRSIFGITGQKISTEEVRELAKERTIAMPMDVKPNCERSRIDRHYACKYGAPKPCRKGLDQARLVSSRDFVGTCKKHSSSSPKIISQIPLAKDIKTELRRNRLSSKERQCAEEKRTTNASGRSEYDYKEEEEESSKKFVARKSSDFTRRSCSSYESRRSQNHRSCITRVEEPSSSKRSSKRRTTNEDNVKNYVVQNYVGMSSLVDLQPASYVQKVHEVVDGTSMIIKQKLDALKACGAVAETATTTTTKKQQKFQRSCSTEDRATTVWASDKSAEGTRRSNGGNGKVNVPRSVSAQNLYNQKSINSLKSQSSTSSSSSSGGGGETSKSRRNHHHPHESLSKHSINSDESNASKVSLPAVKSLQSSKSSSRSVSAQSDPPELDGLVLPPISPESSSGSQKVKDDDRDVVVLPVLSTPPRSHPATPADESSKPPPDEVVDASVDTLRVKDKEELRDSLNVTPEISNLLLRPDSLENSDDDGEDCCSPRKNSGAHASPIDTLKDKLLEIEEVQRRIENVLDDKKSTEKPADNDRSKNETDERARVEPETLSDSVKRKLQELEEAEKRIDGIFESESNDAVVSSAKSYSDAVTQERDSGLQESVASSRNKESTERTAENSETERSSSSSSSNEVEEKAETLNFEPDRVLSPNSYILTEGSPNDIPDDVPTPASDETEAILDGDEAITTRSSAANDPNTNAKVQSTDKTTERVHEAFGELVDTQKSIECLGGGDMDFLKVLKVNYDTLLSPQDLSLINEETEMGMVDSDDEKVLKVVTTSLEEILENRERQLVRSPNNKQTEDRSETEETKRSASATDASPIVVAAIKVEEEAESRSSLTDAPCTLDNERASDDAKERNFATDQSCSSLEPSIPHVPELNLDSLDISTTNSSLLDATNGDAKIDEAKQVRDSTSSVDNDNDNEAVVSSSVEEKEESKFVESKAATEETIKTGGTMTIRLESKGSDEATSKSSKEVNSEREETEEEYENLEKSSTTPPTKGESTGKNGMNYETTTTTTTTTSAAVAAAASKVEEKEEEEKEDNKDSNLASVHSAAEMVNIDKAAGGSLPEGINNNIVRDESVKNKRDAANDSQLASSTAAATSAEINASTQAARDASLSSSSSLSLGSSSRKIITPTNTEEEEEAVIAAVDNDQDDKSNNDQSGSSSQCTTKTMLLDSNLSSIYKPVNERRDTVVVVDPRTISKRSIRSNDEEDESITARSDDLHDDDNKLATKGPESGQLAVDRSAVREKKPHHVYLSANKDSSCLTDSSSIFISAVTKIQSGVRGFLTRRRLRSIQCRSSTLDSVPSIQESFIADDPAIDQQQHQQQQQQRLQHPVSNDNSNDLQGNKARKKKLRREDAMQRTTLSVEKAFADRQLQHTGEFHDCIPLPIFDSRTLQLKLTNAPDDLVDRNSITADNDDRDRSVEDLLEKILSRPCVAAASAVDLPYVDVVLLGAAATSIASSSSTGAPNVVVDPLLHGGYLNFITSVEDGGELLTSTTSDDDNRGVIIEELTSLEEELALGREEFASTRSGEESAERRSPTIAAATRITNSEDERSAEVIEKEKEEVTEDENSRRTRSHEDADDRLQPIDERSLQPRSPITMMQMQEEEEDPSANVP